MRGIRCGLLLQMFRGLGVCLSVCLLDIIIGGAKTIKPIEMPFGVWCGLGWSQGTMY